MAAPADEVQQTKRQKTKKEGSPEPGKRKKHPGRKLHSDVLPVEDVIVPPIEDVTGLKLIGYDKSEVLVRQRERLFIRRYLRPKYLRPKQNGENEIITADPVQRPLPKSYADASALAWILYAKFVLHLPFYRQAQDLFRRYGLNLPQSTLSRWNKGTCNVLRPLYLALQLSVLKANYLQGDETTMRVLTLEEIKSRKEEPTSKSKNIHLGYMWVLHNPVLGHVLFDYHPGRSTEALLEMIPDFKGTLQCDGYVCYETYAKNREVELVSCMAHIRRKFIEARTNDPKRAEYALSQIGLLHEIEAIAREEKMTPQDRLRMRKVLSEPIYSALLRWVKEQEAISLTKDRIGKAFGYAVTQLPKLRAFLKDGRIEIDNNLVENAIRPVALGRKNYLFAGSHEAAGNHAMMYSFFASCKLHGLDAQEWLEDVLNRINDHPVNKIDELLPANYKPAKKILQHRMREGTLS